MQKGKRGLGSIRKLPSGRYQLRYTDPNGQPKAGGTFQTKALAERRLNEIQFAIDSGTWETKQAIAAGDIDPKTVTLSQLGKHWREMRLTKQGKSLRHSTLSEYERYVEKVLSAFALKPIRTITPGQIEAWWKPEHKKSPNQASKVYKHLNTLMKYALKRNWITSNPCDIEGASSYTPKAPEAPTAAQVDVMLEVSKDPFRAIVALAAWGGLRRGEILALHREDLKVEKIEGENWLTVSVNKSLRWEGIKAVEGDPKSLHGVRMITLPPRASELIIRYLNKIPINGDALLFPRRPGSSEHWGQFQINPYWRALRAQAGFHGRFHSLRSFHLTQYGLTGATNAEIMLRGGHGDLKTAMIYQRTTGREVTLLKALG